MFRINTKLRLNLNDKYKLQLKKNKNKMRYLKYIFAFLFFTSEIFLYHYFSRTTHCNKIHTRFSEYIRIYLCRLLHIRMKLILSWKRWTLSSLQFYRTTRSSFDKNIFNLLLKKKKKKERKYPYLFVTKLIVGYNLSITYTIIFLLWKIN